MLELKIKYLPTWAVAGREVIPRVWGPRSPTPACRGTM